jgi:hypothetical protein
VLPIENVARFEKRFGDLRAQHGVSGEVKWRKIGKSHGMANLAIDLLKDVLRSKSARFVGMVVKKSIYEKWKSDQENAFYTTYSLLLNHRLKLDPNDCKLLMDDKQDSYDKQDEVVQIVTNHMAARIAKAGKLMAVEKVDSKAVVGIQAADLITGAITAGHNFSVDSTYQMAPGKHLLVERMASVLGWNGMQYDTYPDSKFNVWHFPKETRGPTRPIRVNLAVPFITPEELGLRAADSAAAG